MGLLNYANTVQNGKVSPYMKLLEQDSVEVLLTVTHNGIVAVRPFTVIEPAPIVEPIICPDAVMVQESPVLVDVTEKVEVKPKRKRKNQCKSL
jgi:hypothetical protein